MPRITPTRDQLAEWAQREGRTLPDGDTSMVISVASLMVADYLTRCTGPATDEVVRDAVCAQAAYWLTNDIAPMGEAVKATPSVVGSASLLGGSMSYAGTDKTVQARSEAADSLCLEAKMILRLAGVHPAQPIVIG